MFHLEIYHYQNPLTEEDDMELRRKSLRARFFQWQQRKYEGKKDLLELPSWKQTILEFDRL